MKIKISKLLKLKIIYLSPYKDRRGVYFESFNKKNYQKKLKVNFVEDDFSINKKNVFKGIHGDTKTWKLVSCIHGTVHAYIVNCDKNSKNFGKWEKFILSSNKYRQILIPPNFGNSFYVKSDFAIYHYKQSKYYEGKNKQFTYKWHNPLINLRLDKKKIVISKRDK